MYNKPFKSLVSVQVNRGIYWTKSCYRNGYLLGVLLTLCYNLLHYLAL